MSNPKFAVESDKVDDLMEAAEDLEKALESGNVIDSLAKAQEVVNRYKSLHWAVDY